MSSVNFKPPDSLLPFFMSRKFITLQIGPVGSVKTTAGIMKIAYHAAQMHPCKDGIRRSRAVWVRNCFDPQTEILTEKRGWVRFPELTTEDKVAAVHGDTLVFETPTFYYQAHYNGKMLGLRNQGVDLLVTPDHKLWMSRRIGRAKKWQDYAHIKAADAYGAGLTLKSKNTAVTTATGTSYSLDFYELLGFWFAEGYAGVYPRKDSAGYHYRMAVTQNPRADRYVEELLARNNIAWTAYEKECGNLNYVFHTTAHKDMVVEFATYGKALTKKVPRKYMDGISAAQASAFLYGYQQGDGTFKTCTRSKNVLRTTSHALAADIQELLAVSGCMGVASFYRYGARNGWYDIVIHGATKHNTVTRKKHWYTVDNYNDMVYCVEVSTHVVMVRRNGKVTTCGQTNQMMDDTSIPDFLKWLPEGQAGTFLRTGRKFNLKFNNVECEVLFRGLDEANDVRRLLSLQATFFIFDEFREINPEVFKAAQGRVGRYPDKMMVPPIPGVHSGGCIREDGSKAKQIWGMSNPPDADTYWEQYFNDPPSTAACYTQPSGLSQEADWLQYLDDDYYQNLAESNDQDWVDVYVHAKFGKSLAGKPVFGDVFNYDFHVAEEELRPLAPSESAGHPLIIGMDLGLTPAVTVNQQDTQGRFLTLDELTSDGMDTATFCDTLLRPLLTNKYPGYPAVIVIDPSGGNRSQADSNTSMRVLQQKGFKVIKARTNSLQPRLAAVTHLLSGQIDGGPKNLISPQCKRLIAGLRSGYRFKKNRKGETEPVVDKNFLSHIVEAHQYACLHVDEVWGGVYESRQEPRAIHIASMGAWT